jgi:hypothetical protein
VACGIKDFSNHSAPMKLLVQPFKEVAISIGQHRLGNKKIKCNIYMILGWFSNHSGQKDEPGNTKPGLSSDLFAQIALMMVISSRLALQCLYFAHCLLELKYFLWLLLFPPPL